MEQKHIDNVIHYKIITMFCIIIDRYNHLLNLLLISIKRVLHINSIGDLFK